MRKIIVSEMVSLDGFFSGPNRELDWHMVDDDFNEFSTNQLNSVDALLFGRVTYQGMRDYWTTPLDIENDPVVADKMNTLPKFVFTRTLDKAGWGKWDNVTLLKGDMVKEVTRLNQQPGRDIVIFGSGMIVTAMAELGLIDNYRIFVVPTVLGSGVPLFKDLTKPINLKLLRTKTLKSGVVLLCYEPARQAEEVS